MTAEVLTKVFDLKVGDEFRMPFGVGHVQIGEYVTVTQIFPVLDTLVFFEPHLGLALVLNVRGYLTSRTIALPDWAYLPVIRHASDS